MTLKEIRTEVWERLGEPGNCDPLDASGLARLNNWINMAYKKVLFWKFPDGTQLRFPCTEGELFFKTVIVTGTITNSTTTTVSLDSSAGSNENQYNGWILETGSDTRLIVDYSASRLTTVSEVYTVVPTGTYTLYKRFMRLCSATDIGADENIVGSPVDEIMEIRKITDIPNRTNLVPARRTDDFPSNLYSTGTPTQYIRRGNDILFDIAPDEERWYRMEYMRMPTALSADTDIPEIPDYFHEAIILWTCREGFMWNQEWQAAYSMKRDLVDFLSTTKQQGEMQFDREDGQVEVE
jgi:hypothetical protein